MVRDTINIIATAILYLFITVKVLEFISTKIPERIGGTFVAIIFAEAMLVGAMLTLFLIFVLKQYEVRKKG